MLKNKSKILFLVFLVITLMSTFCFATDTTASVVTSEDSTAVTNTTTNTTENWTNSDLYVAQDNVTVDNVVDGNAFIVGKNVTITGEIGGDAFVVAESVTIEGGYIYSSLFVCANEVKINGVVYDVYAVCNNFTLESNGFIYRDLKVTGSNVSLNGKVRRDAYVAANNFNLNTEVGVIIGGKLNYTTKTELTIPENVVSGEINFSKMQEINVKPDLASTISLYALNLLKALVLVFVISLLAIWLAPKFVQNISSMKVGKSFACLGIGVATPIVIIIASILLLITVIGSTIIPSMVSLLVLLCTIGFAVASMFFGSIFTRVLKFEDNFRFILFTLVSAIILWAISLIPVVGGFISLLVNLFGVGIVVVNVFTNKDKSEKKDKTEKVVEVKKAVEAPKTEEVVKEDKKTTTKVEKKEPKKTTKTSTTKKATTKKTTTKKTDKKESK